MNDTRYPHYMIPSKPSRGPMRVLCVDVKSEVSDSPDGKQNHTESFISWHSVGLTRVDKEYRVTRTDSSCYCHKWWELVKEQLADGPELWILSYRCARVWSLLLLWEQLEYGSFVLSGRDYRSEQHYTTTVQSMRRKSSDAIGPVSSGALSSLLDQGNGYIVCEDPPNIAAFRPAKGTVSARWVDLRNFGASLPEDTAQGVSTVVWCAGWLQQCTATLTKHKLGGLKATAGSQALAAFRESHYVSGIYCTTERRALSGESQAYIGGRCECYRIGNVPALLWHVDFRSSYASYYTANPLPVRIRAIRGDSVSPQAVNDLDPCNTIALCAIVTGEPDYPYRCRGDALARDATRVTEGSDYLSTNGTDIIYPVGHYYTWLCGPELQDALALGRVDHTLVRLEYDMEPILESYGKACYAMRCEADKRGHKEASSLAKRLLVSIVGKMGQRDRRWEHSPSASSDVLYGEWTGGDGNGNPVRYRSIGGYVQRDVLGGFAYDACPSIAAWITSGARMMLLRAIRKAGRDHVYYVDTDSLFVDEVGFSKLCGAGMVQKDVLGYLQVKEGPCDVTLYGIKHYSCNGKNVCAGLPRGHTVDAGDGSHYWYSDSPVTQIIRGNRPASGAVLRSYRSKTKYRHGVVHEDGRVSPIELKEW